MFKRSFMVLVGILFFVGTTSFAEEKCILGDSIRDQRKCIDCHEDNHKPNEYAYDWNTQIKTEWIFRSLETYLNYKVKEDRFLSSIDAYFYVHSFSAKNIPKVCLQKDDNDPEKCILQSKGIKYYMMYGISYKDFEDPNIRRGALFTLDDNFDFIKDDYPRAYSEFISGEDFYYGLKKYNYNINTKTCFVTEETNKNFVGKRAGLNARIIKYVKQFKKERFGE